MWCFANAGASKEYANVALRKLGLQAALVRERLSFYARFEVVTTTPALIADALDLHALRGLSFYDALIAQALPHCLWPRPRAQRRHARRVLFLGWCVSPFKE